MRLPLQRAVLPLLLYLVVVAALAWWASAALDAAAATIMEDTARLVASEVGAALDAQAVSSLVQGTLADRLRLISQVTKLTSRSSTIRSAEVVDRHGEVFASGEFVQTGRRAPTPEQVFGSRPRRILLGERVHGAGPRAYVLLLPLQRQGDVVGYLRLELDTSRLERLYDSLRRRLFLGALAGLLFVAGLSYVLNLRLRRRNDQLVEALERVARGDDLAAAPAPEELAPALAVAGRLGRELQQERQRHLQADRRLQRLAGMMDVGYRARMSGSARECHQSFPAPRIAQAHEARPH